METNIQQLTDSYEKYVKYLTKFFPDNQDAINKMLEAFSERLPLCPRDFNKELGGVPGGLISFALNVAKYCKNFEVGVDPKKLVRVSLIHELGKLGGLEPDQDLFVPETSNYVRETYGKLFKYNDNLTTKMSSSHRTLFYMSYFGFKLDEDEWVAILTSSGFQYDENKYYANDILPLAQSLQTARTFALSAMKLSNK
jgi:hypothetical protein